MTPLFKKLNLKDQTRILIHNAPESFEPDIRALQNVNIIREVDTLAAIDFALAFVEKKAQLDELSALIASKARGDAVLWFAYPKGTSKKYQCDFNRDNGWDVLLSMGFRPIRQIAIDQDWSALRFRRLEFVKKARP